MAQESPVPERTVSSTLHGAIITLNGETAKSVDSIDIWLAPLPGTNERLLLRRLENSNRQSRHIPSARSGMTPGGSDTTYTAYFVRDVLFLKTRFINLNRHAIL